MKGGWHICLRAWCPNLKLRQTGHLHHIRKAKAVKPSLIYYQLEFGEEVKEMDIGNLVIILIALYFIVKWAVKNGIKEAYEDIKNTIEDKTVE